jgi:hypothetical protein
VHPALEAHDALETETKKKKHQNAEARLRHPDNASVGKPMANANATTWAVPSPIPTNKARKLGLHEYQPKRKLAPLS